MSGKYDDIIDLPHHVSRKHPQMSRADRAAQFAPFAALTGYGAAIAETGRVTDARVELDEHKMAELNERLTQIQEQLSDRPTVTLCYYRPDDKKSGGKYISAVGIVKRIDEYERTVLMEDGTRIPIDDIAEIELE